MNKYLLIFIAIFLSAGISPGFAQKGSEIGIYYLPENTWVRTGVKDVHEKNTFTLAGGAGLSYTYNFVNSTGIQIGALYTSHNQKWKSEVNAGTDNAYTWKGKKRLDYINVPVLLRYRHRISSQMKSAFYAGAEASYLIKAAGGLVVYRQNADGTDFYDLPQSSNSYYNKIVIQAVAGWGFDFKLNRNFILNTALRVEYALTEGANKNSTYMDSPFYSFSGTNNYNSRNFAVGVLMGISYKLITNSDLVSPSSKW